MKKLVPFVLYSTAAAFCLTAASALAVNHVTPKVPPGESKVAALSSADQPLTPNIPFVARTVTTVNDDGPGSLRQTIASSGPGDSINFALPLPATIALSSTLVLTQNLTILGPGPNKLTVMRSTATNTPLFRVFDVEAGVVTFVGITIRNGVAFDASTFFSNVGGGIFSRGSLTLSNCVVTGNSAPTTTSTAGDSLGFGGGIFSYASPLTVINSTFSDNQASAAGGGICTFESTFFLAQGCTVSGNFAGMQGGGVSFQGHAGSLQNCTIVGNTILADGTGSGIANVVLGGEAPAMLTLTACTVTGNSGTTDGGAFDIAGLNDNLGLTNRLLSTLVAGNEGANFLLEGELSLQSLGNNLDSDGSSGLVNGVNGDQVGTVASPIDAKLGPLQNNGGPTLTVALLPGSPAIGAGACADANGAPLLVDQRGFPRPQVTGCDIGAYEFQPLSLTCPPGVVVEFLNETGAVATFSVVVTSSCPNVSTVFTPRSGSVFPIGVTPVVVQATDSCSNSAQCSFNVTVLGAEGVKSNVLAELVALRASVNLKEPFAHKFDDAIADLRDSLNPAYWIDQTHLQPKCGNTAMNDEKQAVNTLDNIEDSKKCPVDPAVLEGFINRIVKCDRLLAIISIQEAAKAGLNAKKVAEDLGMVAKGDCEAAAGRYANAIEQYRNAWRHALQLRLQVCLNLDGSARVQFIGNNSTSYRVEVSVDMVNWVSLGVCTADADGNVAFTDPNASAGPLRFYRAVEQ